MLATIAALSPGAGVAHAASLELTQRPGAQGCVSRTVAGACQHARGLLGARSVVVSPDGRNVYALAARSDTLVVLDRSASTGALRQKPGPAGCIAQTGTGDGCTGATAFDGLRWIATSADGKEVFVGSEGAGVATSPAIAVFDRQLPSGALVQKPGGAGCILAGPVAVGCASTRTLGVMAMAQVSPDGRYVYVAERLFGAVFTFEIGSDGSLARRFELGCFRSPDGTPDPTAPCSSERQAPPNWVTISPDGSSAYTVSDGLDLLRTFARDVRTGQLRRRTGRTACVSERLKTCVAGRGIREPVAVVVSPDGKNVYVASHGADAIAVFDRDVRSGLLRQKRGRRGCLSETGSDGACTNARALRGAATVTISPDGASVYVASAGSHTLAIFSRNRATGALTQPAGRAGCLAASRRAGDCASTRAFARPSSVAVSPDGRNVYVAATGSDAVVVLNRRP